MSTLAVDTIKKADGTGSLTVPAESGTVVTTASPSLGRRNLIINGAMQVAQRGTSGAIGSAAYKSLDRWRVEANNTSEFAGTFSQDSDAPDGFNTSAKWTTTTAESAIGAAELYAIRYFIESQDLQSLAYGSSGAKVATLSFWVKSSVTGTFSITLYHDVSTEILCKSYTIDSANTWEYKTITINANTASAFPNTNAAGVQFGFNLAAGSNFEGTTPSGDWETYSNPKWNELGSTNAIATTTNATWQITGVQLEVGSVATPFEHRSYQDELLACQRYFVQVDSNNRTIYDIIFSAGVKDSNDAWGVWNTPVPFRAVPTYSNSSASHVNVIYGNGSLTTPTGVTISHLTSQGAVVNLEPDNAVLTTGQMVFLGFTNATSGAYVRFDAEL